MHSKVLDIDPVDDLAVGWSDRGNHWHEEINQPLSYHERIRRELHKPLILSGHGVRLTIDKGTLLIRNGFTHYPQAREEWRYFPKDRRLPSRIVLIDVDGSITFDVLEWLSTQGVSLVQINWQGEIITVAGGFGYGADFDIVQLQLQKHEGSEAFQLAKWLIIRKLENALATITQVFPASPSVELAIQRINKNADLIRCNVPENINALLGIEGTAAAGYFRSWHDRPLNWKSSNKRPIQDDWLRIGSRLTKNNNNQFARHPMNAMLNYAYAVLENQVRTALLARGFDLTIGFLHAYELNRTNLVFDFMEPLRPVMDRSILRFVQQTVFSPNDFILNAQGVCRLHPQLAANVVRLAQSNSELDNEIQAVIDHFIGGNETLAKRIKRNEGMTRSRQVGKRG